MPYIVTTKRPTLEEAIANVGIASVLSRCAVATLDKAQGLTHDLVFRAEGEASDEGPIKAFDRAYETLLAFPESGGTVGPLPDGTTIEVEATTWHALAKVAGMPWITYEPSSDHLRNAIIDAYNKETT